MTRPQEINIHRQMTVRLAIVSLNSILSLSLSLSLSSPLVSSPLVSLPATQNRSNWAGDTTAGSSILIVKKMSSRLILKQFRNLIYWNSFQFRTGNFNSNHGFNKSSVVSLNVKWCSPQFDKFLLSKWFSDLTWVMLVYCRCPCLPVCFDIYYYL